MTPNEQGAFCGSCQINVVDFSKKSNEETIAILKENAGKHLCGRFAKTQLFEINTQFHVWENSDPRIFQSKFLLACLLAFGLSLFTGCIEDDVIMGDVAPDNWIENPINEIPIEDSLMGDTTYVDYETTENPIESLENLVMGQAIVNIETMPEPVLDERRYIKGEIAVMPEIIDSPKVEVVKNHDLEKMIMGKMKYVPQVEKTPQAIDTTETLIEIVKADTNILKISNLSAVEFDEAQNVILPREIQVRLYPNPTTDQVKVILAIPENVRAEITLVSLSGDILASIFEGELPTGEVSFDLNLSTYATGTYIVAIQASGFRKYLRVQKVG